MNTDELDATRSLTARLSEWGVPDAATKAKGFVEDMVSRGWVMDAKARKAPRHPKPEEECADHPGEYRINCRPHNADRKAAREEAAAERVEASRLTRAEVIAAAREAVRASRPSVPMPGAIREALHGAPTEAPA